ncbi:hypothetical protein NCCP2495_16870 [Dietzia sp. NCCP-2495]|uniref:hypothetical protein n=1 Tax=Dietzia sp. NCCP-2495 TaxID=2934675 RepID=UPI0022314952|nr:hypothetical protein [Dietzia sp. NCCP-2495]GLB63808.1 hypothetical protein NCCP2495_16870 [Dietzia sp. NCCP-2495]
MTKKTVTDYEADMTRLEADIRATAHMVTGDPDLTDEGKKRRHRAWSNERRWAEQFDATATGLTTALESAQAKAAAARATMTTMPDGDAALAQEMRMNRRMKRIEAVLNAGGTGPLLDLIATADDAELPFLLEHINDHHESVGGDIGSAGAQIVEQALRDRSPEYAQAAHVAGAANNALTIAREKINYLRALIEDPATPPPGEYALAGMSVTGVVPDVAGLTA